MRKERTKLYRTWEEMQDEVQDNNNIECIKHLLKDSFMLDLFIPSDIYCNDIISDGDDAAADLFTSIVDLCRDFNVVLTVFIRENDEKPWDKTFSNIILIKSFTLADEAEDGIVYGTNNGNYLFHNNYYHYLLNNGKSVYTYQLDGGFYGDLEPIPEEEEVTEQEWTEQRKLTENIEEQVVYSR